MKNQVVVLDTPELKAVDESKAQKIKAAFEPMVKTLEEFEDQYNKLMSIPEDEITPDVTKACKRLRLDIGKLRIKAKETKDKQKEYIKLEDKAIMGVHNIFVYAVKEKEDKLKEKENYFEIKEQERLEKLQRDRVEAISPYLEDADERDLKSMDEDVWNAFFAMKKKNYEDEQEALRKAEEERKEKERLEKIHNERWEIVLPLRQFWGDADNDDFKDLSKYKEEPFQKIVERLKTTKAEYEKEQERIRKENERLAAEQKALEEKIKKEKELAIQKEKEEQAKRQKRANELRPYLKFIEDYEQVISLSDAKFKKQIEQFEKDLAEHERRELEAQEIREKREAELEPYFQFVKDYNTLINEDEDEYQKELAIIKKEAELQWEKERKEEERKQKEREKEIEEQLKAKAKAEEEAKKQAELAKGDAAKIEDLKRDLEALKTKYTFKSDKNKKMYKGVGDLLTKVVGFVGDKAQTQTQE